MFRKLNALALFSVPLLLGTQVGLCSEDFLGAYVDFERLTFAIPPYPSNPRSRANFVQRERVTLGPFPTATLLYHRSACGNMAKPCVGSKLRERLEWIRQERLINYTP